MTERRVFEQGAPATACVEKLREALAARDELISVVGHELRNSMAPLMMLAAHFEAVPTADDMMRKKVAMLQRNLKTFLATLDRVTEVSSLRDGKLALELSEVDAQDIVREVRTDVAKVASAAGCELRLDTTSVVGRWDRERLKQIVSHLVGNALRYAGGGPIEISVREQRGHVEIIVQDEGPGIPLGERERLFDRFDRSGTRRSGGLGVGLWVVQALCHAMRGSVRLDDESGRGARFCVALPRG
ncbi:MAG: HAMP domain-containing histidine kinase [Myxococcota bacterium]|nr:HAMP domain-containing histidine kinase [Myxococcota bacterium]